jgi:SAM-dependent methyltransferase
MDKNIVYQTDQIARYFAQNRISWVQFYESERQTIKQLQLGNQHTVLDVGCGCSGLGIALREQFGVEYYTGVEINAAAAKAGRAINPKVNIINGDILDLSKNSLKDKQFDVVFSLSCVDWNVRFSDTLATVWNHVLPGGYLVATFRLTPNDGCNDIGKSYQYINYDGIKEGELASYVVLNAKTLIDDLVSFDPSEINSHGYWGTPSATAVTPYDKLCFAAFSVKKRLLFEEETLRFNLNLPEDILANISLATSS